jgi:hypothetical protein
MVKTAFKNPKPFSSYNRFKTPTVAIITTISFTLYNFVYNFYIQLNQIVEIFATVGVLKRLYLENGWVFLDAIFTIGSAMPL